MEMALAFARDINTMNVGVDETLRTFDPTYCFSRRRLSVMRSARERLVNEVQSNSERWGSRYRSAASRHSTTLHMSKEVFGDATASHKYSEEP